MDYYNISLHGFFFMNFVLLFLPKRFLSVLLRCFFLKNTVDCYNVFLHGFCFPKVFPHMFFFKIIFVDFFFNIELVENLVLTFPTCFFFHLFCFFFPTLYYSFFVFFFFLCFSFRIVFVDFIFLIWSWLRI